MARASQHHKFVFGCESIYPDTHTSDNRTRKPIVACKLRTVCTGLDLLGGSTEATVANTVMSLNEREGILAKHHCVARASDWTRSRLTPNDIMIVSGLTACLRC